MALNMAGIETGTARRSTDLAGEEKSVAPPLSSLTSNVTVEIPAMTWTCIMYPWQWRKFQFNQRPLGPFIHSAFRSQKH